MKRIHPRRYFRKLRRWFHNCSFVLSCRCKGIKVSIGDNTILSHCSVHGDKTCEIIIEDNCSISYSSFRFYGEGGRIIIRERTGINSFSSGRTSFFVRGKTCIEIGKDCLIAHTVDIATTDFHSVLDSDRRVMNADSSVIIGNHVWIGKRVTINKGSRIPDESIVGASSVVTKGFFECNVLIAGNPAMVKKHGVDWQR